MCNEKFDGMIITGAPVEHLDYEDVTYWEEIKEIFDWSRTHVTSTLFICWAAQAGLYHQYGIPKYNLPEKKFGIFKHRANQPDILCSEALTMNFSCLTVEIPKSAARIF